MPEHAVTLHTGTAAAFAKRWERRDWIATETVTRNTASGLSLTNAVCVGGKFGRAKTHGIDSCGVCNGKNKTCTDCAGVVHGKKRLDVCGNCLLEKDPTFDATCGAKLVKAFPTVVPVGGGTKVTVLGTGLQTYSKASCSFEGESGEK